MPETSATGTARNSNAEIYAIRALYSLMVAAVLWIYTTVDDIKSRVVRMETQQVNNSAKLESNSERITVLEKDKWPIR